MAKYCDCNPPGSRFQMIKESYYRPDEDRIIYKYLCCNCGHTQEITYEDYISDSHIEKELPI